MERYSFPIVRANGRKLRGNCAFPQNYHTRKLGEITVILRSVYKVENSPVLLKIQRHIQNSLKHIKWSFMQTSKRLKAVNYFHQKLQLIYLTGF